MGLRPPIVRRATRATSPASPATHESVAAAPAAERPVRPHLERSGPRRTADQLFRSEEKPAADAVTQAYQVFDRYLKEGQEYAAGQSAWYHRPTTPSATGSAGAEKDLVNAAMWLFDQMRGLSKQAPIAAPAPSASWPKPRWPAVTETPDQSKRPADEWLDESFSPSPSKGDGGRR